jgi:2-(1,2-epoxy-1,2-dihydrophenyl)acetyl-CoA isomerase
VTTSRVIGAAAGEYAHIGYEVSDAVAWIELRRPEVLNAWIPEMGAEVMVAVERAGADPEVRSILLTGAGRAFSSGGDLRSPRERRLDGRPDLQIRLRAIYNPLILRLRQLPKPVVCGVQGAVAGIGASIALACDLVVAAESAYFLLAFVRVGMIPDGGALVLLSQRIGSARALRLAMLGERLPAAQAAQWGVLQDVVPDAELADSARAMALRLAAGPTVAYANIKRLANETLMRDLSAELECAAALQQEQGATADYEEGVAAFTERREPRFTGN